jgi:hypothetical protein
VSQEPQIVIERAAEAIWLYQASWAISSLLCSLTADKRNDDSAKRTVWALTIVGPAKCHSSHISNMGRRLPEVAHNIHAFLAL